MANWSKLRLFVIAPNYLLEKRTIAAYFRKT